MDNRMRKLVEQAFINVEGPDNPYGFRESLIDSMEDIFQEFARLIAKECSLLDFRHKIGLSHDQVDEVSDVIKQHFGVET